MPTHLLQEEIEDLKTVLDRKGYDYQEGVDAEILESLKRVGLPAVYQSFLSEFDPGDAAWRMGSAFTLILHRPDELSDWQSDAADADEQFIIGSLNGQALALSKGKDTRVYRLDEDETVCVSSSFNQFLQIVRAGLEMLGRLADYDEDGEDEDMDDGYDDMDDYHSDSFASGREDVLNDYLEEIESIDPEVLDAWTPA